MSDEQHDDFTVTFWAGAGGDAVGRVLFQMLGYYSGLAIVVIGREGLSVSLITIWISR